MVESSTKDSNNVVLDRYQFIEEIGHGSFGSIFKANDLKCSGKQVAIKVLKKNKTSKE